MHWRLRWAWCWPSFVIILLVAAVLRSVLRYAGVQAVLDGVRPCVVAMILATAVTMGLSTLGGYTAGPAGGFAPDGRAIAVFVLLGLVHCGYKKNTAESTIPHWDDPAFCRTGHRVLALRRAQPSGCCFSSCRMARNCSGTLCSGISRSTSTVPAACAVS